MKRNLSLLLAALLTVSALAGCGPRNGPAASSVPPAASSAPDSSQGAASTDQSSPQEQEPVKLMVLSGPTGVGAAKLMADNDAEPGQRSEPAYNRYAVTVASDNTEAVNALINGDADIAAIATNVAANLFEKTDGGIQLLAVNTLGVLYILEKGDTVRSIGDLRGKTLYAPSNTKGANPEHILNHLLEGNGVDPSEVHIEWLTPQEITVQMVSSDAGICMLPVPAATALLAKDSGVREAVSLSQAWEDLEDSLLPMGCVVARTGFLNEDAKDQYAKTEAFLAEYQMSIDFMNDPANLSEAAALAARYGFAPNEKVAAAAIPQCSLTFIPSADARSTLESYYAILFRTDPASIGGSIPYDSFYYGIP